MELVCWADVARYIVSSESFSFRQYVNLLRPEYSMYKLPWVPIPWFIIWFTTKYLGFKVFDYDLLLCTFGMWHMLVTTSCCLVHS